MGARQACKVEVVDESSLDKKDDHMSDDLKTGYLPDQEFSTIL